jgi:predicted component of type VI protein secretion system
MHRLVAEGGCHSGRSFPIEGNLVIGRGGEADVQLLEKDVSRQHACVFERDDGAVMLVDLSSQNGTFVDGEPIKQVELRTGDRFRVGESIFTIADGELDEDDPSLDFKVQSGPALDATIITSGIATKQECTNHALHQQAIASSWRFCPACGRVTAF